METITQTPPKAVKLHKPKRENILKLFDLGYTPRQIIREKNILKHYKLTQLELYTYYHIWEMGRKPDSRLKAQAILTNFKKNLKQLIVLGKMPRKQYIELYDRSLRRIIAENVTSSHE